ncbi:MAG: nucleotidyltransferase domain-containing protein [Oligoflexales bacterium]|nr:nucleotidyltransferase domain-containing protein [Oligoflexales bacterium]
MSSVLKGLTQEQTDFLVKTIRGSFPGVEILAFGSRVHGTPKKYSDLDICLKDAQALNLGQWAKLDEVLAESSLPILVDISDYHLLSEEFRQHVLKTGVSLL